MEANTYWNHATLAAVPEGLSWVEASGPTGSVAVGGGGYGSFNTTDTVDTPFFPVLATRPHPDPDYPNVWQFGFQVPPLMGSSGIMKAHVFVVCLEDIPA